MDPHSPAFERLKEFISGRMRMSHIYQPLMLKVLLDRGGRASTRDIASAFLARDDSQLDYYAEITKRMPGRVLASHGLVERDGAGFLLIPDARGLSPAEKDDLTRMCDAAVAQYIMPAQAREAPS